MKTLDVVRRAVPRHVRLICSSCRAREQALPEAKLRLVISLHHQARSFVTPENLDVAIVRAFTPERNQIDYGPLRLRFQDIATRMRNARSHTVSSDDSIFVGSAFEYGGSSGRDARVRSALFGTEQVGKQSGWPGLEAIRDEMVNLGGDETPSEGKKHSS